MTTDIRKQPKQEQEFYLNDKDEIQYNPVCERCAKECKLSFRTTVYCPNKIKVKTKKEYLKKINSQNKTVKEVANAINIHTRTLKSLLTNNNRDIDFDTHKKLMRYLFNKDI